MGCYKITPKNVTIEHVKGHQDDLGNNHNLTLQAKINILMDKRAASAHTDPSIPMEEMTTSTIHINGKVLTGQLTYSLRREISECKMKVHYQKKITSRHNDVLWKVFFKAISKFKRILRLGFKKTKHDPDLWMIDKTLHY